MEADVNGEQVRHPACWEAEGSRLGAADTQTREFS